MVRLESSMPPGKYKDITVIGYVVYEEGHMPNPMAAQNVFKIVKVVADGDGTRQAEVNNSPRQNSGTVIQSGAKPGPTDSVKKE